MFKAILACGLLCLSTYKMWNIHYLQSNLDKKKLPDHLRGFSNKIIAQRLVCEVWYILLTGKILTNSTVNGCGNAEK